MFSESDYIFPFLCTFRLNYFFGKLSP